MHCHWTAKLGQRVAHQPVRAAALAILLLLLAAPGLVRLELRTDGALLVPATDPAVLEDREVRRQFGLRDPLLILLETEHSEGIFNPETLHRLSGLTKAVASLEGVDSEQVLSLATERSPRFHPNTGEFLGLLDPPPKDQRRLTEVRAEVEANDLLHGTLVSLDRKTAVVMVGIEVPDPGAAVGMRASTDRRTLYEVARATAKTFEGNGHQISVVGPPAAEALLGTHILEDLLLLIPLAFLVVGLALWLVSGRLWASATGLLKVGAAQLFTFGLLGWSGEAVTLPIAMIPVVLATIGIADEVHLLCTFCRHRESERTATAIKTTLGELARPVLYTSLTTALGLITFLLSELRPVASFGLFTAIGVLFSMLWSLTVTPSLWALLDAAPSPAETRASGLARRLGIWLSSWRWHLPLLVGLLLISALGLPGLSVQDSWIHNFSAESPLRRATERADQQLAGTHTLHLALTFHPPAAEIPSIPAASGPLLDARALHQIEAFEAMLRSRPEAGAVFGLAGHLKTTAFLWGENREDNRRLVPDPHWIHLHLRRLANVRGEHRRRELVDDALAATVVTVLVRGADYRKTEELLGAIRRHAREHLEPARIHLAMAGDLAVSQAMIPAIVRTQILSLLLALAGCALMASLLLRSIPLGLLAIAPSTAGLVCTLGLLGWLEIPLGVATSMFCAVTLGIGVDYSLHLLTRCSSARQPGDAARALATVAPAILIDAVAVILGFGLLLFSQVPANRWLGLAVAVALATTAMLTIGGLGRAWTAIEQRNQGSTRAGGRRANRLAPEEAR